MDEPPFLECPPFAFTKLVIYYCIVREVFPVAFDPVGLIKVWSSWFNRLLSEADLIFFPDALTELLRADLLPEFMFELVSIFAPFDMN